MLVLLSIPLANMVLLFMRGGVVRFAKSALLGRLSPVRLAPVRLPATVRSRTCKTSARR
jgi:hypothetical protein